EAGRSLPVQVARVGAGRTRLAREHPAVGAISHALTVAQPVQTRRVMKINAPRLHRTVALALSALAVAAIAPLRLAAQGNERLGRATDLVSSASAEPSHLEPARGILRTLVGTWRFEIWFAGNYGGAPDASGTRVVKALFDDLRLEWTEQLDHSTIAGQGVLGFDPGTDRFFSSAVYSAGAAPEFLTGTLDAAEPLVTFSSMLPAPTAGPGQPVGPASIMTMLDQNHFAWTARDPAWRAMFTRQE